MAAVPFREALYTKQHPDDTVDDDELDVTARIKGPGLVMEPALLQREDLDSIGPYQLGPRLGRGGMAEVFSATYAGAAGFERRVCVKRILPNLAMDAEFRALFTFEAQVAGTLCHSNIVQVFDCIEQGETLAIIMEMVDGTDLKRLLRHLRELGHPVPVGVVGYIAGQLLSGLRYAHSQKIVHRDVSPHNVLVSKEGEVKLADFGVAKALATHATVKGTLKGKIAYMSPEQAAAQPVDRRTDLYSAGLVLYELLMSKRFFPSASRSKLLSLISNAGQPRLTGVEPNLALIIEKLLAPSPDDRFQTAQEALDALPPWEVMGPVGSAELATLVRMVSGRSGCDGFRQSDFEDRPDIKTDREYLDGPTEQLGHVGRMTKLDGIARHHPMERQVIPGAPDMPTMTRARDVADSWERRQLSESPTIIARRRRRPSPSYRLLLSSSLRIIALAGLLALLVGMSIGACGRLLSRCGESSVGEVSDSQDQARLEEFVGRGHVLPEAQLDAEALGDIPEASSD